MWLVRWADIRICDKINMLRDEYVAIYMARQMYI